jgi:hypothetical protein
MMTRTIDDYLALLPSASRSQPKFVAFISTLLDGLVDVQNTVAGMPDAFDIDTAVGAQLDAVGVRVGLSRQLAVPLAGVYFSLDTAGVGLDQGVIRGPFDPADALTSLDDETYRLILKIKVRANNWNGSLEQAQSMLAAVETAGTHIFMQDNFDMSATLLVSGVVPSTLFVSLLKQMKDWIRPAAVDIPSVYVTSKSGSPLFGLDVQNSYIGGLDSGAIGIKY